MSLDLKPSTLVIDGDYLAYLCAASLEHKCVVVKHEDKLIGKYKNRTEFKKSGKLILPYEEYTVMDEQSVPDNWESQLITYFKTTVRSWNKNTDTNNVLIALGAETNHRDNIPTPTKYKYSRKDVLKPLVLSESKKLLEKVYETARPEVGEADDFLAYAAFHDFFEPSLNTVICTVDKDARMVPTKKLYNPMSKEITHIPAEVGEVLLKGDGSKSKLVAIGRLMVAYQLLHGDTTDSYAPCDVYKQINNIDRVSPIITDLKAYNLLKDCKTDRDYWKVVVDQYANWYITSNITCNITWTAWDNTVHTGDYIDIMQMTFDALWMKRWETDRPQVREILDKLGII